ncbi:MAG TPA: group II intron reverse transcriptase/maturase [Treponema sp.]|nr:MAG: group II intron reverse transcriptase/maturase [Treponema sp. GWC1_61_84]HCM26486.1 group II intron reverse transcriptase/maturase [Treponema sp.]
MERVLERENLVRAYKRVVGNHGSAGVDGITVEELKGYIRDHWENVRQALLAGKYQPQPVLRVEIPKPDGKGKRKLGIPVVIDRMIQQALLQVINPIYDSGFSDSSYRFRVGRSAQQAILQAREYVKTGKSWVVDIDLEKFFDRVNHDMLMARVARKITDKRVLKLIRGFLNAGVMENGLVSPTKEGTPQGGPLSPLLSNIMLDDLDKELEKRGLSFCRYADDCNIYVGSQKAGDRVKQSITQFITTRLKLKVNEEKSAVDRPDNRKFLGYTIAGRKEPRLKPAKQSIKRLKDKVKAICKKGRGRNIRRIAADLTPILRGWVNYFKLSTIKGVFDELDQWIRRRLRDIIWRQWKRPRTRFRNLDKLGLDEERAAKSAWNGRGAWWNAGASHMNQALPNSFFEMQGLLSLSKSMLRFQGMS